MASFTLITNGIDVFYDEDGFFAKGLSTTHKFFNSDWQSSQPPITGMPIQWSIRLSGADPFENYVSYTYPTSRLSPRVPLLRDFFSSVGRKVVGMMHRWDQSEPIALSYYFPNDTVLAAVILGAVAAHRELVIGGSNWHFLADDNRLAPAPTVDGFMQRNEPAFATELPQLQIK